MTWVGPIEAATQADLAALPARAMLGLFLSADADAADGGSGLRYQEPEFPVDSTPGLVADFE